MAASFRRAPATWRGPWRQARAGGGQAGKARSCHCGGPSPGRLALQQQLERGGLLRAWPSGRPPCRRAAQAAAGAAPRSSLGSW